MLGMAGTVGALLLACSLALASGQRVTFDAGSYLVRSHLELGRQYTLRRLARLQHME